jgi:hypothetical protein
MTDRTTKALLLALTVGVWLNILTPWFQATPVEAQATTDPCDTRVWEVVTGSEHPAGQNRAGGWHVVKWNVCTGETVMYANNNHNRLNVNPLFVPDGVQ